MSVLCLQVSAHCPAPNSTTDGGIAGAGAQPSKILMAVADDEGIAVVSNSCHLYMYYPAHVLRFERARKQMLLDAEVAAGRAAGGTTCPAAVGATGNDKLTRSSCRVCCTQ